MNVYSLSFHFVNGHSYHSLNCCVIQGLFLHFLSCSVWFPVVSYTSAMLINWMNFIICFIIHSILTFILFYFKLLSLYINLKTFAKFQKKCLDTFILTALKLNMYLERIDYQRYYITISQIFYFFLTIL